MLFKKIEIHGFKSFAEPVTIEFNEGITGVVGPNGSGKSNISDAIRWVLGEQSPKMLRGGKMEEVIFNGTASRKSRGMAEVTLVVDNNDGSLPIDYNEVAITRRMFRSGESEYHINGNQCRLRDIRELIMDTGIGVDGYSLIGQGKIADIISNKTESRREIFEEAAGIVAYRTKKSEAERKLASTTVNMDRVQDIIGEIEGRIDGLKEESIKAGEYLELKEKNRNLEINIILKNVESLENRKQYAEEDLRNVRYSIESLEKEKEESEREFQEINSKSEALEAISAEAQKKLLDSIEELNTAINKGEVDRERLQAIDGNKERLAEEIKSLKEKKERESANAEEFIREKEEIDIEAEEAKEELQAKVEIYNDMTEAMAELAEIADSYRDSIFSLTADISAGNSEINSMLLLGDTLKKRKETILEEKESSADDNKETLDSLNENKRERAELAEEIEYKKTIAEEAEEEYRKNKEEERKLSKSTEETRISLGRLSARKKTIEEMESNYEGYNYAVKHVMKAGFKGIYGVVAELISVPKGFETAIETALGGALQNVICEDEQSAKAAIKSLKDNKAGRMTFLPVKSIKGRGKPDQAIKNEAGFAGFASECVEYDSRYSEVISYLLGQVVIAKDMDSAIAISRKHRGPLLVTLDGEIINSRGAITGGKYRNKTANILDRKAELVQLASDIKRLEERQEADSRALEKVRNEIRSYSEKIGSLDGEIRAAEHALMVKDNEIKMSENVIVDIKNSGDKLEKELANIMEEQENTAKIIKNIEESIKEKEELIKESEAECEARMAEHESKKQEFNRIGEEITSARIKVTQCNGQKSHAEDILGRINKTIGEIEGDILTKETEIKNLETEKEGLLAERDSESMIERLEKQKAEAEQHLREVNEEKSGITSRLAEINVDRDTITEKMERLKDQKYDLDVRNAKNETQLETYKEKLWDDFEVSYLQAMEFKAEDFVLSKAVKENRQIRNRLKELGEVNLGSIEEYKNVKERYEFLTGERYDVQKAMDDLTGIINEMDKTIKLRFRKSFDLIVSNFENQFKNLFGGGHAELRLSDADNPLESSIDIVAQPPGKKLQNINLLSGGEKTLTAIALMFAVLEAKPTPFCILDEVEAALDDANIDRFINCLRQFEGIQFTLVTHQKATMEHADVLYGVTMPEKGISKVLSLSLEDDLSEYNG